MKQEQVGWGQWHSAEPGRLCSVRVAEGAGGVLREEARKAGRRPVAATPMSKAESWHFTLGIVGGGVEFTKENHRI